MVVLQVFDLEDKVYVGIKKEEQTWTSMDGETGAGRRTGHLYGSSRAGRAGSRFETCLVLSDTLIMLCYF